MRNHPENPEGPLKKGSLDHDENGCNDGGWGNVLFAVGAAGELKMWFKEPVKRGMDEPLPIGNGRIGGLITGWPAEEDIVLNDSSLWKGDETSATGDCREWSCAWRTALYARLHDGESAHDAFFGLLSGGRTCLNLFGFHGPMQIDGNFGITAGVCEMLMQSHEDEINLLPAIPKIWVSGAVKGLRARGGFEVDQEWKDGKLVAATVRSTYGTACRVRYGEKTVDLKMKPGESVRLNGELKAKD
jgi:alpha-L-fucosidase 2